MAIAETRTLLPLDTFAKLLGVDPLHFNQVALSIQNAGGDEPDPVVLCDQLTLQYDWQGSDAVSRNQIAQVIADAEHDMAEWLGFKPALDWEINERIEIVKPQNPNLLAVTGLDLRGQAFPMQTRWGYVHSGGIEAKTLITAGASVVYTDADGDGYFETATVTVATSVTDSDEIALYYPGQSAADAYEIRPITASITGGVATITCRREQLVLLSLIEGFLPLTVEGTDNTLFLTTADVYRHWTDPSSMVQWEWEGLPLICSCLGSGTCPNCLIGTQTGCVVVRDEKVGLIAGIPATYDATDGSYTYAFWSGYRVPDRAHVWYRAGLWDPRGKKGALPPRFARAVAYMAAARLDRPLCSCSNIEEMVKFWAEDKALNVKDQSSWTNSAKLLECPFGTRRGEIEAWKLVSRERIVNH